MIRFAPGYRSANNGYWLDRVGYPRSDYDHARNLMELVEAAGEGLASIGMSPDLIASYSTRESAQARVEALDASAGRGYAASYIVRKMTTRGPFTRDSQPIGVVSLMYPDPQSPLDVLRASVPRLLRYRDMGGYIVKQRIDGQDEALVTDEVLEAACDLARVSGIVRLGVTLTDRDMGIDDRPESEAVTSVESAVLRDLDNWKLNTARTTQHTEGHIYGSTVFERTL